jgi:hypothetical protein
MRLAPALFLLLTACSPTVHFAPAAPSAALPREAGCEIELLTAVPQRPYQEIGTFDLTGGTTGIGGTNVQTAAEFLDLIRDQACAQGADAVVAVKAQGYYREGTALRWAAPATAPAAPAAPAVPSAPAAPASPAG